MELRHLRSFVVTAEELHVGRAAGRLHLTQPSLSRQIAALERDLGVELFSRVRRRLGLTPAGEIFLASAKDLVRRADQAVTDARTAERGELGTLRLRFVQSATHDALPRLLGAFRRAHPGVVLNLETMTTLRQIALLRAGEIDVGLLRLPIDEPTVATRVISRDPLVVALPAGHPLAARARLPLRALAGEPFVLYTRASGPSVHDAIVGHCVAAGFTPRIIQEAADVQTIVSLVAAGLGVSLLIAPTPPSAQDAVVYRPLTDRLPRWDLALAWPAASTAPVLVRFLAVAGEAY
ncbi:MAG TPA: LysR substrate-binding domain-containing protein [Actinophytocola sp.]|uniref:LysR family transcriptional regulator n=1 Tax=Actinophytocola sp. TaxID=1872138 RepID=UPI002DB5AA1E|nr:LysR substrate-binding domain-containing protein [Actinophytocola sp.]HEU5470446.1 LysR substrate-binding domain-containing protein [Actinophytocola sp.]